MFFSQVTTLAVAGLACLGGVNAQNKFPLVGVHTGKVGSQYPPRREIRDLFTDSRQWSLFVQALNSLQAVPETNLTSYFQVGGIHGYPYAAWDGVNPQQMGVDGIPTGYCPHGNILFGLWHRPYLALIEQLIASHAQVIAKSYNSAQWTDAANKLRLPYWDWALPPVAWPVNQISVENVTITTPTGSKTVRNPLYRYKFQGVPYPDSIFPSNEYLAGQPHTLRSPNTQTNVSQEWQAIEEFPFIGPSLTRAIWSVFAKQTSFNGMTTTTDDGPDFEGIHGTVHIVTGGHMAPAQYTGFEPLFWLHHAAVDRQIALWQAIRPNAWLTPAVTQSGTWTIYPGTNLTATTPLTPFTRGDKTFPHNSNTVRYTHVFGYGFSDIPSHVLSGAALSANVTARVNQLYNPDGTFTKRSFNTRRGTGYKRQAPATKEWTLNTKVPNTATGQGFSVAFTLKDVIIGQISILNAPSKVELDNGVKKVTKNEFSLTPALEGETDIAKAIKEGLKWVITNNDGTVVPASEIKSLEIRIAEQDVTPAEDETSFPLFGEKVYHDEILA